MTRNNRTITIAAGTPVRLSTEKLLVRKLSIQMLVGAGTGVGYVMAGIRAGRTPAATVSSDLTRQLAPSTATVPGGLYEDRDDMGVPSIDLSQIWVDGSHTGDTAAVSWEI